MPRVLMLRADAPAKPRPGAPCNGCGVCCAEEPCPVGMLLSRRRRGRCKALAWQAGRYVCTLVSTPQRYLPAGTRWAAPLLGRYLRRLIAAGRGCDSHALAEPGR
ncbi:hypothetical protein V4F39_12190 [Aquincola sp. MAHUQ-54]|uniref:4Fe-4S ferredoxin-type domain-containing protein n=1 Tax=Aquincola agrisoli TaxID=3119538 RepID=A0AAW9QH01_9BURK